ncbi:hypothetical protein ABT317_37625, partial [Streptomyces carpinensis]
MEPTESAAPHSRLRRVTGVWRGCLGRTGERSGAQKHPGRAGHTASPAGQYTAAEIRVRAQPAGDPPAGPGGPG